MTAAVECGFFSEPGGRVTKGEQGENKGGTKNTGG